MRHSGFGFDTLQRTHYQEASTYSSVRLATNKRPRVPGFGVARYNLSYFFQGTRELLTWRRHEHQAARDTENCQLMSLTDD